MVQGFAQVVEQSFAVGRPLRALLRLKEFKLCFATPPPPKADLWDVGCRVFPGLSTDVSL